MNVSLFSLHRRLLGAAVVAGILGLPAVVRAQQTTTDALHYRLDLALDFSTRTITGVCTGTFRSLVDGLAAMDLDLRSELKVRGVKVGGKVATFTRPGHRIHVLLDRSYRKGESFAVEVSYGGSPPRGAGFAGLVFSSHSGSPVAWTLSEPWDAKAWWPCKDVLGDKSTFELWLTHPATMTAVGNGTLQGIDQLGGGLVRTRWKENYPIVPYLVSFAVTNYRKRVDTYTHLGAKMPVEFYVFPENWTAWQTGLNRVVPMLTAFSDVYGQYPFVNEKYGIAQFTWGGGMEHQTVSSQVSVAESLTSHELSHQWWGDMITCATWHDIWLNEGFATFSEAIWEERKPGGGLTAYHSWMRRRRPYNHAGTVYVYDTSSVGRIFNSNNVYRKGAWVLHQLRWVLGDTVFFKCLREYRKAFEGGSATTDDFRRVCERTSGKDLRWFFDQWVMKGGSPYYRFAYRSRNVGGRDYLYLKLDQTQSSPPLIRMPVEVRVTTARGTVSARVEDDERNDAMVVPLPAPPRSVAIDPDQWILRQGVARGTYTTPFFAATPEDLDVVQGGAVEMHIDRGAAAAGRRYVVVLGMSGSSPGTNVFGLKIPVNFDALTTLALGELNSAAFSSFLGSLDAAGGAVATFRLPPGVGVPAKGRTITAAYVLVDRFDFASRPLAIRLR